MIIILASRCIFHVLSGKATRLVLKSSVYVLSTFYPCDNKNVMKVFPWLLCFVVLN